MRIAPSPRLSVVFTALVVFVSCCTFAPRGHAAAPATAPAEARPTLPYHLVDQFPVGGEGAWGRVEFDPHARRLFVSRGTSLQVVDVDGRRAVRELPCTEGPHGLVLAPDLRRGYLTCGSDTSLVVFDLDSLRVVRTVKLAPAAAGPIVYDPTTQRVIVLDPAGTLTALDASTLAGVASHDVGARPQAAVSDGAGALYVALPDLDAVAVLDARTLIERTRWPIEAGARPAALAFDAKYRRLFVAGKGLWLAILDTDRGHVVSRLPLGGGVEGVVFDPDRRLLATIGGGGASSTVWQQSADQYMVIATVGTSGGARTIALDPAKHLIYSAAGQMGRTGRSLAPGAKPQLGIVPGSFAVLILAP